MSTPSAMRASRQVYPGEFTLPKERFPYQSYQCLGILHICLGLLLAAVGCYDVLLYLRPGWLLPEDEILEPSEVYIWTFWGYPWVNPSAPVLTGTMVSLHGLWSSCTCRSTCTSQKCLTLSVLAWSLCTLLLFAPVTALIGIVQGIHALQKELGSPRHFLPLLWGSVAAAESIIALCSTCLACCCTQYDPEIPDDVWERYEACQALALGGATSTSDKGLVHVVPVMFTANPGDHRQNSVATRPDIPVMADMGGVTSDAWNIPIGRDVTAQRPRIQSLPCRPRQSSWTLASGQGLLTEMVPVENLNQKCTPGQLETVDM